MSEIAFQKALVKILTDTKLRRALQANAGESSALLGLPPEAVERVLEIDPDRLEIFAEMVMSQRVNDVADGLPMTSRLLGENLGPLAAKFYRSSSVEFSQRHQPPLEFARFLAEYLKTHPPSPFFLNDILKYEMTTLEMFDEFEEPAVTSVDAFKLRSQSAEQLLRAVPLRLPNVRVLSFSCDVLPAMKVVKENGVTPSPIAEQTYLLLLMTSTGAIEQSRANLATATFFEACDGKTSLDGVIESVFKKFHQRNGPLPTEFTRDCLSLCMSLVERGLIGLAFASE